MPTMPTVVGLDLQQAEQTLETAGVLSPAALGYFGSWPITVRWVSRALASLWTADTSLITADSNVTVDFQLSLLPGQVLSQSIQPGSSVSANSPLSLSVIEFPVAVAYP